MGGGGGCKTKNLLWGEYGYLLDIKPANQRESYNWKLVDCLMIT